MKRLKTKVIEDIEDEILTMRIETIKRIYGDYQETKKKSFYISVLGILIMGVSVLAYFYFEGKI